MEPRSFRLFGELSKVEEQDDGTIIVFGTASSGARDSAGEIILPEAMKAALPDYMKWANIREMHDAKAAGTTLGAEVQEDGRTYIETHIVDAEAVKKVKAKVYKGFSVGGKVETRDPNDRSVITKIRLHEISLVDRPCNPEAAIDLWKADGIEPEETEMTDQPAFSPTNKDVRERAEAMAKAAGKPGARYADYVVKAREALVAEHAPEPTVEAGEPDPASAVRKSDAGEVEPAKADDLAKVDDVAELETVEETALSAAMRKAQEALAASPAPGAEPATGPFADLGKAAAAVLTLATKAAENPIYKGLYTVGWLADLMAQFAGLQSCLSDEAMWEGDGSALPQQAADIVQAIAALLVAAAKEEAAEAVEAMNDYGVEVVLAGDDEVVELATSITDLVKADSTLMEKAGKRNSKADAEKIQGIHDHATKLGATCDAGNCADAAKAELADDLAKAQALAQSLREEAARAAPVLESITKALADEREANATRFAELEKRLAAYGDEPRPARTAVSTAVAVSKAQDIDGNTPEPGAMLSADEFKKALAELPEAQRGELLLKVALKQPLVIRQL